HSNVDGSTISDGPKGPTGWKRDAGSGLRLRSANPKKYRSPGTAPGTTPEKYPPSSASSRIVWRRSMTRASGASPAEGSRKTRSSAWCAGAQTRKCVPSAPGSAPIGARRHAGAGCRRGWCSEADSVSKDRSVELDEERVVVALVGIGRVVGVLGASVGDVFLGI